jgi:hypothetical protein
MCAKFGQGQLGPGLDENGYRICCGHIWLLYSGWGGWERLFLPAACMVSSQ